MMPGGGGDGGLRHHGPLSTEDQPNLGPSCQMPDGPPDRGSKCHVFTVAALKTVLMSLS